MISKSEIRRAESVSCGVKTVRYSMQLAKAVRIEGMNETEIQITDENAMDDFDHKLYGMLQIEIVDAEWKVGKILASTQGHIPHEITEVFRKLKALCKLQG